MQFDEPPRCPYRLVVAFPDRIVVFRAAPFTHYRQAVAHVSAAVRRHAGEGQIVRVCLERGAPLEPAAPTTAGSAAGPEPAKPGSRWVTVEQWGGEVVERILEQAGGVPGAAPAPPTEHRAGHPAASPAAAPAATHPAGHRRGKGHRWHVGVALILAIIAWLALAAVLADGRLENVLGATAASPPAVATELPFEAASPGASGGSEHGAESPPLAP